MLLNTGRIVRNVVVLMGSQEHYFLEPIQTCLLRKPIQESLFSFLFIVHCHFDQRSALFYGAHKPKARIDQFRTRVGVS